MRFFTFVRNGSIAFALLCLWSCATTREFSPDKVGANERLVFGRFVHEYEYEGDRPYEYFTYRAGNAGKGFLKSEYPRATMDSYGNFFWITIPNGTKKFTVQQIAVGLNGFQVNLNRGADDSVAEVSLPESNVPVYLGDVVVTTEKQRLKEALIGGPSGYIFYAIAVKDLKIKSDQEKAKNYLEMRGYKNSGYSTVLLKLNSFPKKNAPIHE